MSKEISPQPKFFESPPNELIIDKYQIHFEPGVHAFPYADKLLAMPSEEKIAQKFAAGDLTAHSWNPEVAKRMRAYSPMVLGLDSVNRRHGLRWTWLPGSPKEMNNTDSIYVVGGDLLHQDFVWDERGSELAWGRVTEYAQNVLGIEATAHVILPPALALLLSRVPRKKLSRRDLLRFGLAFTTLSAAGVLGKLAPVADSYSTSPDNPARNVSHIIKPFLKSTWLDGRTALVIAKTISSMERLHLPEGSVGSVVMGFPHAYEAPDLFNSEKRAEVLRKYAIEYRDDIYPVADQNHVWEFFLKNGELKDLSEKSKKELLMDYVLAEFAFTTLFKVKEPETYQSKNPAAADALIERIDLFTSSEVLDAVSDLGNREHVNAIMVESFKNGEEDRISKLQ